MPREQLKMFGRIELIYWMGGVKHPLTGSHAVDVLANALVQIVTEAEPLYPNKHKPVLDRVERIYNRVHKAVEIQFQDRWRSKAFER